MTITVTPGWQRAMERAQREGLKATLTVDGTFRVRSVSKPGTFHTVSLDEHGHIAHCSDCKGWENGGRQRPCKHAGAAAIGRAYLTGVELVPAKDEEPMPVASFRPARAQIFRAEAGA